MYIRAGIEMRAPAADCRPPIAHCDADCDYNPFDDGPRDSMGWTEKERFERAQSEERADAWTRWYNRKKRLQTLRSRPVRQTADRNVLRAASSPRPHIDTACRDVNDKSAMMPKKLLTEEDIAAWHHLIAVLVARQTSESP